MKAPAPKEALVQRAIISRLQFLGVMAVHIPNAGKRTAAGGRRLKSEGMRAGFPDLACYGPNGEHALLEVKRPGWTASAVSDNQRDCHAELSRRGIHVAVVASQDEAVDALRLAGFRI